MAAIHVPPSSRRWALRVVTILGGSVSLHRGQAREGKALAGTKGQRGGLRASGAVSRPVCGSSTLRRGPGGGPDGLGAQPA